MIKPTDSVSSPPPLPSPPYRCVANYNVGSSDVLIKIIIIIMNSYDDDEKMCLE